MQRTHYDSLKIARDAPAEVVRAAYRALSLKYHPDRHAADPEATEMMALLNSAYDVLSDPEKRREYDEWVKFVESRPAREGSDAWASPRSDWIGAPGSSEAAGGSRWLYAFTRFRHYWVFYVLALVAIFLGSLWYESLYLHRSKALTPLASAVSAARQEPVTPVEPSLFARPPAKSTPGAPGSQVTPGPQADSADSASESTAPRRPAANRSTATPPAPRKPDAKPNAAHEAAPIAAHGSKQAAQSAAPHVRKKIEPADADDSVPDDEDYARPAAAPNGEPWPSSSDYIGGYHQRNTNGLSQVVLDNSKNSTDAFVKIVSVSETAPRVVRSIFLQASDRFTVNNLRAGNYEIRYQNLDTGILMRSEVFALEESAIASGTRYSTVTLTLRSRPDETMNTFSLAPEEF